MVSCRCQKGLTIIDTVITLCLIGILIGVVIPKYQQVAREAQETALKAELTNIRTGIKLFSITHGRKPLSISEMIEKKTLLPGRIGDAAPNWSFYEKRYLLKNTMDAEGNKLDPFGNPYRYDRVTGEVNSTTEGYQDW